jgi:hypothetical protein
VNNFHWTPGADPNEGKVLEISLPSGSVAYLQYLTKGNLSDFARVLDGDLPSSIQDAALGELVARPDAFVTQCFWRSLSILPGSASRGRLPVPEGFWQRFAVRVAPGIRDLDDGLFITEDGHVRRGRDVRSIYPHVDLSRSPMSSCPTNAILFERIELGWTPAVAHDRLWLKRAREVADGQR